MENYNCVVELGDRKIEVKLTEDQIDNMMKGNGINIDKGQIVNGIDSIFNIKEGDNMYYVNSLGGVSEIINTNSPEIADLISVGNASTDEKYMLQKAMKINLYNLLDRFSREHGWRDELWNDKTTKKWIIYKTKKDGFSTMYYTSGILLDVYFVSKEIAEQAIKDIIEPFMTQNPNFIW